MPSLTLAQQQIVLFISAIVIINVFFTLWYVRYRKRTVKCRVLKEYGDSFEVVAEKKVKLEKGSFDYNKKSYVIDPQKIIFTHRKGLELFYKEDEAEPMIFKGATKPRDSKVFGKYLKSEQVSKLITGYKDKYYIFVIICLIVAVIGISIFSLYTFNKMNKDLITLNQLLINQTKPGVIIG